MAGLASLTANYTDSEDEDREDEPTGDSITDFPGISGPPSLADRFRESRENTPLSNSSKQSEASRSARSTPVKKTTTRLVSYIDPDDDGDNDDDDDHQIPDEGDAISMDFEKPDENQEVEMTNKEDKNSEPVPMDLDSGSDSGKKEDEEDEKTSPGDDDSTKENVTGVQVDAWTEGVKLPPEPTGLCSAKLQENINRLWKKKQETNFDMNAVIQNKKAFRNPSIYEKLIEFCGIDEHGTNFPKELYDGHLFGKESYYDELAKVQKAEMDRREKMAAKTSSGSIKSAAEAASASAAAVVKKIEDAKRKSKWDQGPAAQGIRPVGTAVIPAFGALTKKH